MEFEVVCMLLLLLLTPPYEKPLALVMSGLYDVLGVLSIKSPAFFKREPLCFLSSLSFFEFSI
jgi:hypothetical protein